MKAIIIEIHKEYSIVLTEDGQFLKHPAGAGLYEIGDDIFIDAQNLPESIMARGSVYRLISRFAIGFTAVAVIAAGSYFGIQFLKSNSLVPAATIAEAAAGQQERSDAKEIPEVLKDTGEQSSGEIMLSSEYGPDESEGEDYGQQDGLVEGQSQDIEGAEKGPLLPIYEGSYVLDKINTDIPIDYPDIKIYYHVEQEGHTGDNKELIKSLLFEFIQNKKDALFNGSIDTVLRDMNLSALRTETVVFENFKYGEQEFREITLGNEEKSFKLIIYGSFD